MVGLLSKGKITMTTVASSRPARSPAKRDWVKEIKTKGSGLPSRLVFHGVEGIGKTSFATNAPKPIFLMAKGETGLETLIDAARVPETPHFPELMNFNESIESLEWLRDNEHDFKTVVLDTLNGFERLCHEFVCKRDFNNEWGNKGFASYQAGFDVSMSEWRIFLNLLDQIRGNKKMAIICLCHTKVKTFKNPEGADFDRYLPEMHEKTWGLTHKWADHILFANFYTVVESSDVQKKGKAIGGQQRVMYTVHHAAYDAKNRAGLPEEIEMGNSGPEAWNNFISAMKGGAK